MPPLRTGRASKACELCRKYKTRCYASDNPEGTCLRCRTLCQPCSLDNLSPKPTPIRGSTASIRPQQRQTSTASEDINIYNLSKSNSADERLERLERTVGVLLDRLDRLDGRPSDLTSPWKADQPPASTPESFSPTERSPAPVLLIRDAAKDAGVRSPEDIESSPTSHNDVISTGLVALPVAQSLLQLFHIHYGRWVRFADDIPTATLLPRLRRSPLLLCCVFLIAVRHTKQALANELAPQLFQEAKSLITASILTVPQSFEFFQAALILSLWSTTIGQVPLSIDSWLLTGYALQQASASPDFDHVFRVNPTQHMTKLQVDAWCLWNHLFLAHLQYCVGTRRQPMIDEGQISRCAQFAEAQDVSNFEARMVAEIKLYWIIHFKCNGSSIDLRDCKLAFERWKQQSTALLDQPRSQFLQMGYHFAHLLAYSRSLKSPDTTMGISNLDEMIERSTIIINLAINTTDDRTRHLTDQIFHMVTFSALVLCRFIYTYKAQLETSGYDIDILETLIAKLIDWLRAIGLPCHAAYMLGDIVSAYLRKLRPNPPSTNVNIAYGTMSDDGNNPDIGQNYLPPDVMLLYPNFIGSEFLDINGDGMSWLTAEDPLA